MTDLNKLQIQVEEALKKFVKDWKTLDQDKINTLMQYGIVQEVMKVEERKAVRREQSSRSPVKSPRTNRENNINKDLNGVKTVLDSSYQKQLNFKKNESPSPLK